MIVYVEDNVKLAGVFQLAVRRESFVR